MEEGLIVLVFLGAAVHGVDFENRRNVLGELLPVDSAPARQVSDVMGEGKQLPPQPRVGADHRLQLFDGGGVDEVDVEVARKDGVVPRLHRVDLETGIDQEAAFVVEPAHDLQVVLPSLFEPGEAPLVKIDDVVDLPVALGHVGPRCVAGYRADVQALPGVAQGILQVALPVGDVAVIVQIGIEQ